MPIYPMLGNYIVMNIDESVFCMPIYPMQGNYNLNIPELQLKLWNYNSNIPNPGLWLDKANLNNGITTQISLIMACGVVFDVKCLSSRV